MHWYGVDGFYCLIGARLEYKLERGTHDGLGIGISNEMQYILGREPGLRRLQRRLHLQLKCLSNRSPIRDIPIRNSTIIPITRKLPIRKFISIVKTLQKRIKLTPSITPIPTSLVTQPKRNSPLIQQDVHVRCSSCLRGRVTAIGIDGGGTFNLFEDHSRAKGGEVRCD